MAITNLYPNLPAHLVQFKDGGLTSIESPTEDRGGKSLLLLGTAFDGPIMEPVQVDATTVDRVFGKEVDELGISNGATLTKYAKQALKCGFHDVRCMRVTGTNASVKIVKSVVVSEHEEAEQQDFSSLFVGNSESEYTLAHTPVAVSSFVSLVDGIEKSPTYVYLGSGQVKFDQYIARQYADVEISYDYFDVSEKEFNFTVQEDEENNHLYVQYDGTGLTFDDGESIYTTEKETATEYVNDAYHTQSNPAAFIVGAAIEGETMTYNKDEITGELGLFESIAFGENNAFIAILPEGTSIAVGDTIKLTFLVAKRISETENYELGGSYDGVGVPVTKTITADSFSIEGKTAGTDYDIDLANNQIVFYKAGRWPQANNNTKIIGTYTTTISETREDSFTVNSRYGGSAYNGATVEFSKNGDGTTKVTFTKPVAKIVSSEDLPFYYNTALAGEAGLINVGQLREQLANYSLNTMFDIVTDDDTLEIASFPTGVYTLTGGTDGVNVSMDDMFQALSGKRYTQEDADNGNCTQAEVGFLKEQGAYQYLENYNVDFIIPVGIYADVVPPTAAKLHTTFHNELATVCAVLTYRTKMTHGFIDVKPNTNTTLRGVQNYVEHLLTYDNVHYMGDQDGVILADEDGNKLDIGWYTSIVVGPDPILVSDKLGRYYGSPAIAYAALCSSLRPESAPTNKAVPGAIGMRFAFSNKQMNELVGNKFVVFKQKNANNGVRNSVPYVVDGCTAGAPNSDYGRISTVKIVTSVVDNVREVCEPYIGEPNTIEQRNAMSASISKRLSKLMEDGVITSYEFQVDATIQEVISGECRITLVLTVPMELRKITTTVALRAAA